MRNINNLDLETSLTMIMNNKMQDFEGICLEKFCSLYECLVLIIHNLQFYFQTCTGKSKDYEHIQHEF